MKSTTLRKKFLRTTAVVLTLALTACSNGDNGGSNPPDDGALVPIPTGHIKWNPGHYVKFSATVTDAEIQSRLDETQDLPFVKGIVVRHYWKNLEPLQDQYDFRQLDRHLEIAARQGKHLFLLLTTKGFNGGTAVPDYVREAQYDGGAFRTTNPKGHQGENIALWNDGVRDRLTLLIQKLAQHYDDNPNFEGLIFNETAFGQAVETVSSEKRAAFYSNLVQLNTAARDAFTRTMVVQYVNFPAPRTGAVFDNLLRKGIAFGAPDTFLADESHNKHVYPYNDRAKGLIPIVMQVESDALLSPCHDCAFNPPPVEDIYEFARNQLHSNYMIWDYYQYNYYRAWDKILGMFRDKDFPATSSGGLSSDCPFAYLSCEAAQ